MAKKIVILQGHPDSDTKHLCHALADAYEGGAVAGGHSVETVDVSRLNFPLLRSQKEWIEGDLPDGLNLANKAVIGADHMVIVFPLWLGSMPALLKGFLEQVLRPKKKIDGEYDPLAIRKVMKGKSAHIIITMGMPGFFYRLFYRAHSLKSLKRNILGFIGVSPVRSTLVGAVDGMEQERFNKLLRKMHAIGKQAR